MSVEPKDHGLPSVLVPFPGPAESPFVQDIFVYLRPETNGVLVESTLLKVVQKESGYRSNLKLVYLANFPGEYIVANHIVEQYYSVKIYFAVHGKDVFTPTMVEQFENNFGVAVENANVIGAFEALRRFKMTPDQLFSVWVRDDDVCMLNGQCVKRIRDSFVVNYDIPALLHKNSSGTDIAVMVFRTDAGYPYFRNVVHRMHAALVDAGMLHPKYHVSRAFHYSKGPFEEILDGFGYLYGVNGVNGAGSPFDALTFTNYLRKSGVERSTICGIIQNPIVLVRAADGGLVEDNILQRTMYRSYEEALLTLRAVVAQRRFSGRSSVFKMYCPADE